MRSLLSSLFAIGVSFGAATAAGADEGGANHEVRQGGISLRLSLPPAGDDGVSLAGLQFTDAASGAPFAGMRPAAWLQLRRSPAELETPCEDRARQFAAGSLGQRADIDLNAYRLVSLNQDASITFINPLVRIRSTRLEAIVALPGNGHDWAYDASTRLIAVTLRNEGQLAVVDAAAHRLLGVIDLGSGSQPTRVMLEPGGRRVWVGLDGADAIVAIDLPSRQEVARIAVGHGPHTFATVPGQQRLAVAHAGSAEVSLIDSAAGLSLGRVAVPAGPVGLAYSSAAQRVVVLSGQAGVLSLLAPGADGLVIDRIIALEAGALTLAMPGDGRYAMVTNVLRHEVALVDLARYRVSDRAAVAPWPDQIAMTRDFAYVRSQTTNRVTLFGLERIRAGKLQALEVQIGRAAASDLPDALNVAPLMAAAPEGSGIYAAIAADAQLYRYNEGLMVPSGSLSNYRRPSRGLMVIDESLRERDAGHFEAPLRVDRGGTYDVVVRNGAPAFTACFSIALRATIDEPPARAASPVPVLIAWRQAGRQAEIEVALRPVSGSLEPGGDLVLLVYAPAGAWQRRVQMNQSAAAPDRWSGVVDLPAGVDVAKAELLAQSLRHGLPYTRGRLGRLGDFLSPAAGLPAASNAGDDAAPR